MANNLTLEEWVERAKNLYLQNAPDDISDLEKQNSIALAKVQGILAYELASFGTNIAQSIFFDTAPEVDLIRNGAVFGFFLKEGEFAKGDILIKGTAGYTVPINTEFKNNEDKIYKTTKEVILSVDGSGIVEVASAIIGIDQNTSAGDLEIIVEDSNINSAEILALGIVGGFDGETIEEFRSRILVGKTNIATFGKRGDYIIWAKEASPSVTRTWEDRNADNIGTLNVYVYNDNGVISEQNLADIQTYIDSKQTKEEFPTKVLTPNVNIVDLTVSIDPDTPANRQLVTDSLELYLFNAATVGYPNFTITNSLLLSNLATLGLTSIQFFNPVSDANPSFILNRNDLAFFNIIFQ